MIMKQSLFSSPMAIISKSSILLILLTCCWAVVGYSQESSGGGRDALTCIQKLLPCEPYLKGSTSPPPATCCLPLKQMVVDDPECLCRVFNNPALLKSYNITQDDAVGLVKSCRSNADTSQCKNNASSPSPAASGPWTKSPPTKKSAASTTSYSSFVTVAAAILSSII